jgi:hypothetical protein
MALECLHPYFPFSKCWSLSFSRTFILHSSLVCIGGDFHSEFIKHESIKFYKYCNIQFMLWPLNNTNVEELIFYSWTFFSNHWNPYLIILIFISNLYKYPFEEITFWSRFPLHDPIFFHNFNPFYYFNVLVSWYSRSI